MLVISRGVMTMSGGSGASTTFSMVNVSDVLHVEGQRVGSGGEARSLGGESSNSSGMDDIYESIREEGWWSSIPRANRSISRRRALMADRAGAASGTFCL